jgi:type I restriction enzyme S subunit
MMSNKIKTTATKEEVRPSLVPKLRFPEFRDDPGWEQVPLGQLAVRVTARNLGGDCTRVLTNSAERGVLDQRDYFEKDIATAGNLEGYYVVNRGDYVYNPRISNVAPVGPISRNNIGQGVMSPLYTVFRFNSEDTDFYSHYFKTTCWHTYLRQVASMGARHDRMSISVGDFVAMPLPALYSAEQQKIAECLSSVDELMAAQARKVDALKTHKKGLMQQLFPREGEPVPRLRFPEFKNAGEWEESPLSNFILSLDAGVSVNSGDRPANKTELGVLKTSAVTNGVFEPEENKVVLAESEQSRLKEPVSGGTIIICRKNTPALVGANVYVESRHENLFLPDLLWAAKPRAGVSMRFLAFVLGSEKGRAALSKLASGSSVSMSNITKPDVLAFSVMAPSPAEQQRIAECLTTLDDLIAAETQKLEALKTHKKGLMQQLFPSPEEASDL